MLHELYLSEYVLNKHKQYIIVYYKKYPYYIKIDNIISIVQTTFTEMIFPDCKNLCLKLIIDIIGMNEFKFIIETLITNMIER